MSTMISGVVVVHQAFNEKRYKVFYFLLSASRKSWENM